jgi:hypothetical protein
MPNLPWPPEIDAIKIEQDCLYGRIKDTQIWLEIDQQSNDWLILPSSTSVHQAVLAWSENFFTNEAATNPSS